METGPFSRPHRISEDVVPSRGLEERVNARPLMGDRDIVQRARAISKANAIVTELAVSLDHEHGGEVTAVGAAERLYGAPG